MHVRIGRAHATTSADGRYAIHGLAPGRYTLTLESSDVPPEKIRVIVKRGGNRRDVRACSTTLDYGCTAAPIPESAPNG